MPLILFMRRHRLRRGGLDDACAPLGVGVAIIHLDPLALEVLHDGRQIVVVEVRRGMLHDLIERHEAPLLTEMREILYDFLAFLYQQAVSSPSRRHERAASGPQAWACHAPATR